MGDDRQTLTEALARAWASMNGKPWKGDYIDGYLTEAAELLNRAEARLGREIVLGGKR